ncbi:carbohydrate esterase family 9 protein [Punctularia strigosozonata HHB-11173 SS5]|uniref:carbohydrate esterase family 9 protein n=1 Tax=Punctularia strigosozonata (strain HHB-11173) TaxID=741275 RepID=UPI0004416C5D|nr:carbohydrate esterase family 9 protein [Punctularia strigosozonata HHB-11173 SS5]EIN11387.1 carbohydrate esterase family 9 protein [Punctularia strigosozonata HHB-11173 SS5]
MGNLKSSLPRGASHRPGPRTNGRRVWHFAALSLLALAAINLYFATDLLGSPNEWQNVPRNAPEILARCRTLQLKPGPERDFFYRAESDRFVEGTKPVLLRNATIWTGEQNGTEVFRGNVLMSKGMIKAVGHVGTTFSMLPPGDYKDLVVVDLDGAWLTPGIVDLHSHIGDGPSPVLSGSEDYGSPHGPIVAWLRALDGLNTHDDSYPLSIAGGVTTALVLPGSGNAIGGQGFPIKLRKTAERTPTSMLLEPPYQINGTLPPGRPRWRHMKHACGENPSSQYHQTRMDTIWAFRQAYDKARQIKEAQDDYCHAALRGQWSSLAGRAFPDELQWEAMVDILRGKVKVQAHCYEPVDLDALVRISNEFKFPIAAVHHASSAWLVPDLLKASYEHPPAVAMFAANSRYKREAYRHSEFGPRILANHGLDVVMKSDHSVMNSRYLLFEAQQAFFYGLPENLAIASVTSTPARIAGLDHRVGFIKRGWDADVVVWDSHPLSLGATPKQVYIDGIPQLADPQVVPKPDPFQVTPEVPNFDDDVKEALEYDGLPPLRPRQSKRVMFINVSNAYTRSGSAITEAFSADGDGLGVAFVENGRLLCIGAGCPAFADMGNVEVVDLQGGAIQPSLITYGSPLGLLEMESERSTADGAVLDPLVERVPDIAGGDGSVIRAVDGLVFDTRDQWHAYRAGVTAGIASPIHRYFAKGLGTAFSLGAGHKLEEGAVLQDIAALHVAINNGYVFEADGPSVSTQIATLRRLLFGHGEGDLGARFQEVSEGRMTLVVDAQSADIIATLLRLKADVEKHTGTRIKMTLSGATEAHLLAKEIAEAGVGVVLVPVRPFPFVWETRRVLPGPPLTPKGQIGTLLANGVKVGIGIIEKWEARNTRFDLAWAALEANGTISRAQAFALASSDLEQLLGVDAHNAIATDHVATVGGDLLSMNSKVAGVISPRKGVVDLF